MGKQKFYAVARGREPGIYGDWESCKAQVLRFEGATYKSFFSRADAEQFMANPPPPPKPSNKPKKSKAKTPVVDAAPRTEAPESDISAASFPYPPELELRTGYGSDEELWFWIAGKQVGPEVFLGLHTECGGNRVHDACAGVRCAMTDKPHPAERALLEGALLALRYATRVNAKRVRIHYGPYSQEVVSALNAWMWRWADEGWRSRTRDGALPHVDLYRAVHAALVESGISLKAVQEPTQTKHLLAACSYANAVYAGRNLVAPR